MNPLTQSKNTTILPVLIALTLVCFALSPQARAVCQEGCLTNDNTVLGDDALLNNGIGVQNTAIGFNALFSNTVASFNTATGFWALYNNLGGANTATGNRALYSNTTGFDNTATGYGALQYNTIGNNNTANGIFALFNNTTGDNNTASGSAALNNNIIGGNNTGNGYGALGHNTGGSNNTAIGAHALGHCVGGDQNIAIGRDAGLALRKRESNNIDIGNAGVTDESNAIRIGRQETHTATYVAGISGTIVPGGVPVIVDTDGHLGTTTSSARYKEAIQPMNKASEAILALKPVTFRYKHEVDPEGMPQFGLVAEEVEKVNPDLVARDDEGKPYSVRYEAVNAMLLNEFLKAHRKVEEQGAMIAKQQKQIEALIAGLQKVSAQLEARRGAKQTLVSNP